MIKRRYVADETAAALRGEFLSCHVTDRSQQMSLVARLSSFLFANLFLQCECHFVFSAYICFNTLQIHKSPLGNLNACQLLQVRNALGRWAKFVYDIYLTQFTHQLSSCLIYAPTYCTQTSEGHQKQATPDPNQLRSTAPQTVFFYCSHATRVNTKVTIKTHSLTAFTFETPRYDQTLSTL